MGYSSDLFFLYLMPLILMACIAFLAGWWAGRIRVRQAEQEVENLRSQHMEVTQRFQEAIRDLARAEEQVRQFEQLRAEHDHVSQQHGEALQKISALEAHAANHEKQLQQLIAAREELARHFGEIGGKLLGEAQKSFLERASERFAQSEEKQEERIKTLLQPVGERLKSYEDKVEKIEHQRSEAYGNLTGLIEQMRAGQDRVQREAARLVNSLRNAPKARGRWGEQQLRNVLESCGLAEHTDFLLESSVTSSEGERLRPDAIIRIPGGRSLVVDAKVSLNDYQDAFAGEDEEARKASLARHCASMKTHIDGLSRKAYWDQFDEAPDYVIMFVPGEHFLTAALDHDPELWDHAFRKQILLATPTNLVAIARTIASVWRQEGLAREAQQIGELGKELYDRLAIAAEHLKKMGGSLDGAVRHYNKFVGSFERNVLSSGRRFAELNIETGKRDLEVVDTVESLPRYQKEDREDGEN